MIFACICNENGCLGVLVEDLLDATIVDALPGVLLAGGGIIGRVLLGFRVAEIFCTREVVGWVEIGVSAGGRGGIMSIESWAGQLDCIPGRQAGRAAAPASLRGERAAE